MKKFWQNKKWIFIVLGVVLVVAGLVVFYLVKASRGIEHPIYEPEEKEEIKEEEKSYTVLFDTNGGELISPIKVLEGGSLTKPEDPKREGYTFVSWTLNDKEFDFSTLIQEDLTLKAVWEKEKTTEKETTSSSTSTSSGASTGTSTSTGSKSSSTIDKINLNDYISVTINYYNYTQPGGYYFITNMEEVFPELAGKKKITVGWNEDKGEDGIDLVLEDFQDAVKNKFTYDTDKEEKAKNVVTKMEKKNIKGVKFTKVIDGHGVDYKYEYLTISNTSYHDLNKELKESKKSVEEDIGDTFKGAIYVTLPGYGVYGPYDKLLTNEVCEEYSLTCDKW